MSKINITQEQIDKTLSEMTDEEFCKMLDELSPSCEAAALVIKEHKRNVGKNERKS